MGARIRWARVFIRRRHIVKKENAAPIYVGGVYKIIVPYQPCLVVVWVPIDA